MLRLLWLALAAASLLFASGCEEGGIGDPCIPEDEYRSNFSGYSGDEVNVESRSFQCETRVCLVNKFQGRVSCKYGQDQGAAGCKTPDESNDIEVPVEPQLQERRPDEAVYCSCRCKGPQANAPYCECPDGFQCIDLIDDIGLGNAQLAGGYCVKSGTDLSPSELETDARCEESRNNCGTAGNYYE